MNPCKKIDLNTWPRRTLWFTTFRLRLALRNITVSAEAQQISRLCQSTGESSFCSVCMQSFRREQLPQMKQRILDEAANINTPVMTRL